MKDDGFTRHDIEVPINITKIVTIHYFEYDKYYRFAGEAHDCWEIVYVDKGDINITAGDKDMVLHQGEAYFHKPNEFHSLSANGVTPPNIFVMTFVCESGAMGFFEDRRIRISNRDKHYISSIIREAYQTFDLPCRNPELKDLKPMLNPVFGGEQMIKNYLEQFLITLVRSDANSEERSRYHSFTSTENRIVPKVISILEENVYGRITVGDICRRMRFSKTYISKIFLETTGYSIGNYYTTLKVEKAKELIRDGEHNFTQIADMLCFSEPRYFSRVFKRVTNMTPTQYSHTVSMYK